MGERNNNATVGQRMANELFIVLETKENSLMAETP